MSRPLQRRQDEIRGRRVKRKLARQARLRRQVLRYSLLFVLVAAGVAGVTKLPWAMSDSTAQIQIHGNKVVTSEQIRQTLHGVLGKPLYKLDPTKLERSICSLPDVRYAFVRRYALPRPHLRIEVLEEFPWATYCTSPDAEPVGVISETGRFVPLAQFPTVVQPALRICAVRDLKLTPQQISDWSGWVSQISLQTGKPVTLVDMRQPTAVTAYCDDLTLHLGAADSGLNRRLNRLASIIPVTATLKNKLQYIDLSLESNVPLKLDKNATASRPPNATLVPEQHGDASNLDDAIGNPPPQM